VDLHRQHLHPERCAGGRHELPGDYGDGECGGECGLPAIESGGFGEGLERRDDNRQRRRPDDDSGPHRAGSRIGDAGQRVGSAADVRATVRRSAGAADLATVWVWFTSNFSSGSSASSCLVYYAQPSNQLFLVNDAGTAESSSTLGAGGVALSNSQCLINAGAASVAHSGTDLILNLPVTFTAAYDGAKSIYMYAAGSSANSGWQTMGSWTVQALPAALTVTSTHSGSFTQGQNGAVYTVTVANASGAGPTDGPVTVTETAPAGLTLVSMTGSGWTCGASSCARSDGLAGGSSYPAITATVNVGWSASGR